MSGAHGIPSLAEAVVLLRSGGYFVSAIGDQTDEEGASILMCCSRRTLRNWRDEGYGPACFMTSRWIYPIRELLDFVAGETKKQMENRGKTGKTAIPDELPDSE